MDYDSDSVFPVNKTGRDSELRNMFRHGKVTEIKVSKKEGMVCCRVQYFDKDGLISKFLPVKQQGSRSTSCFYCPKVGDDVNVTMLPNGDEDGFIDGSFYNTGNPPPIEDPNTRHITFADTTIIEYAEGPVQSREKATGAGTGTLTFSSNGPMFITCGNVVIEAGSITLRGAVTIEGNLHVTGDISNGGNMNTTGVHTDSIGRHDA